MIRERVRVVFSGWLMLPVVLAANAVTIYLIVQAATGDPNALAIAGLSVLELVCFALFFGFFIVNPNEAQVLQLFGAYAGTVKSSGFGWANPLFTKRRISQRVRNFESQKLKVNDNE